MLYNAFQSVRQTPHVHLHPRVIHVPCRTHPTIPNCLSIGSAVFAQLTDTLQYALKPASICSCYFNCHTSEYCTVILMESRDSSLVLRRSLRVMFSMTRSWFSFDTCMSCLGSVSRFRVSSRLMSHILTMSLPGITKCLGYLAARLAVAGEQLSVLAQYFFYVRPIGQAVSQLSPNQTV